MVFVLMPQAGYYDLITSTGHSVVSTHSSIRSSYLRCINPGVSLVALLCFLLAYACIARYSLAQVILVSSYGVKHIDLA